MCRSLPIERTTTSPELRPTRICTSTPVRAAHLLGVPLHRFLHPERGVARPHGVVLVGERRAEQRHDAVAHHLVDGALVAVDGLHHVLEHGIEELARLLGIAVGEQLHRALEVGEEDRDLLAFTFQRRLRVDDPLGEVFRGVRVGSRRAGWRGRACAHRRAALLTELRAGREFRRARRAHERQPPTTLQAELGVPGVLVPALRATHHGTRVTGSQAIRWRASRIMGPHHRRRATGQVARSDTQAAWRHCYDRRAAMPFIPRCSPPAWRIRAGSRTRATSPSPSSTASSLVGRVGAEGRKNVTRAVGLRRP